MLIFMKGISPLIATVLIVALVIFISIIITSSLVGVTKSQTEVISTKQQCARGGLYIIETSCPNNVINVVMQNIGEVELTNFSIFANINNQLYVNNSPVNGDSVVGKGELITLQAYTAYDGAIKSITVMAGNCPQISMEVTNETKTLGTC